MVRVVAAEVHICVCHVIYMFVQQYIYAKIYSHTYPSYIHIHTKYTHNAQIRTYMNACMYAYMHAYMHTYVHTYVFSFAYLFIQF